MVYLSGVLGLGKKTRWVVIYEPVHSNRPFMLLRPFVSNSGLGKDCTVARMTRESACGRTQSYVTLQSVIVSCHPLPRCMCDVPLMTSISNITIRVGVLLRPPTPNIAGCGFSLFVCLKSESTERG